MEGPNHGSTSSSSEEKRLELRLGPPGDQDWSLGYLSNIKPKPVENNWTNGGIIGQKNQMFFYHNTQKPQGNSNTNTHFLPVRGQDLSQACSTRAAADKADTAGLNSSQKRCAPAPVVGWPPIRSFRRNLATTSSSKSVPELENAAKEKSLIEKPAENIGTTQKGFLVKINMDGVPIGRKVDLKVHNSYEKLSSAVDELFRGLLAAQRESCAVDIQKKQDGEGEIKKGLVDGISGEYTLVYEDNEGDRMLVGDVPWHMFVSTVKRLRVLKTSDLSSLRFGSKEEKVSLNVAASK